MHDSSDAATGSGGPSGSDDLEGLLGRARAGDTNALGALTERLRPVMFHVAHLCARPGLEADELVSAVTLRFVEAISRGGGPTAHPASYVTTAIRNLAIDFARSRTSRERSLESPGLIAALPAYEDDTRSQDLAVEFELVRESFDRLPESQRRLLREVVLEQRKPRELAARDGVRPNTVSVQLSRAKDALAVNVRTVLLERGAYPGCAAYRPAIARRGRDVTGSARAHLDTCDRCRAALSAFHAIPGVLTVLVPVLAAAAIGAAGVAGPGSSPSAAAARPDTGVAASAVSAASGAATSAASGKLGSTRGSATRRLGWTSVTAGTIAATVAIFLAVAPSPAPQSTELPSAAMPSADAPPAEAPPTVSPSAGSSPGAQADSPGPVLVNNPVSLTAALAEQPGSTRLDFAIRVAAAVDGPVVLDITLPDSMRITGTPAEWTCPTDPGGGSCRIPAASGEASVSVTTLDGEPAFGALRVSVHASSGPIQTVGTIDGTIVVR